MSPVKIDEKYMNIAIQLAKLGIGKVSPNPMVGCVIVNKGKIIGQGFHEQYGAPHAEVNAINNIQDKSLLKESTLYVNLEPCSHFGKTPPCADLIIKHKIPKVVIGCKDTFSEVSGKGIKKLQDTGVEVVVGVLEHKSIELNKRFFNYHSKKRPYVILKWAKTPNGFMDVDRANIENIIKSHQDINGKAHNWITTDDSKKLVHHWRTEVQAVMVGTNTVLNDNPQLTVREVEGKNPLRVILDLTLRLPSNLRVFDGSVPTMVLNHLKNEKRNNIEYVKIDKDGDLIDQVLRTLYHREVQSILIEGGAQLLHTFFDGKLWDEARVFTGVKEFKNGLKAPEIENSPKTTLYLGKDQIDFYVND